MTNKNVLPDAGFVRLKQILGDPKRGIPAIIPVSRSHWHQMVKDGVYPQPVRSLGKRIAAYRVEDIRLLAAKTAGEAK